MCTPLAGYQSVAITHSRRRYDGDNAIQLRSGCCCSRSEYMNNTHDRCSGSVEYRLRDGKLSVCNEDLFKKNLDTKTETLAKQTRVHSIEMHL